MIVFISIINHDLDSILSDNHVYLFYQCLWQIVE